MIKDIRSQTPKRNTTRLESEIKTIVRHHSATTSGDFFAFWNNRWKGLGWVTGGYHEIILRDGTVQLCYDPNMVTNGVLNHNSYTYHICVVGNGSFTEAQEKAFDERCKLAMKRFNISVDNVKGHGEITSTQCPGINMDMVRNRLKVVDEVEFKDVPKNHWVYNDLKKLHKAGIAKGYDDGTFRPNESVTRAQMVAMLARMIK